MQVKTYRARSLKDALQMVQHELGPEARVVQTRELETRWWERFAHGRQFEIRTRRPGPQPLPLRRRGVSTADHPPVHSSDDAAPVTDAIDFRHRVLTHFQEVEASAESELSPIDGALSVSTPPSDVAVWFETLSQLIDAEVPETAARQLIDAVRSGIDDAAPSVVDQRRSLIEWLGREIDTCGPIQSTTGQRRTVALVGPTGVGKTTTIAKLAANFRLREHRRVGLITVDTYRVAAVEQLRTYAEIMDLPIEVVATPREMNAAIARLADQDVVFIDTAGHSPRDAVQLQQLKSLLAEARPDELHLVLSAVSSTSHLDRIVQRFAPLGTTAVVVTKLDEATGLGSMLPVLRDCQLPISYMTCGQSVPDDIIVAKKAPLLNVLVGQQPLSELV